MRHKFSNEVRQIGYELDDALRHLERQRFKLRELAERMEKEAGTDGQEPSAQPKPGS
jgi:hypothetical protein